MDNQHGNIQELYYKAAYTFGFLLGDGHLGCYPREHATSYVTSFTCGDTECLLRVQQQFHRLFPWAGITAGEYRRGQFILQSARREIWEFFALPTEFKQVIPQVFFGAPREVQQELIAGLMDSDGCCEEFKQGSSTKYKVVFSNQKLAIVKGLGSLWRLVGCAVGELKTSFEYTGKSQYRLSPNIYDFARNCYFHCKRKQDKLDRFRQLRCASETLYTAPTSG